MTVYVLYKENANNASRLTGTIVKTLTLIRHAKSSWAEPGMPDFERSLNKRGKRDIPVMGQRLAARGCTPDLILSSPAKRARKTAKHIAKAIAYPKAEIVFEESLYEAYAGDVVNLIRHFDNSVKHLMLIGHNPTFTVLANDLTNAHIDNVPTCGVIQIEFDCNSWGSVPGTGGTLMEFDFPKKAWAEIEDENSKTAKVTDKEANR